VRMRLFVVILVALAVLVTGVLAVREWSTLHRPANRTAAAVVIDEGLSGREVLEILHRQDLLPSIRAGRLYLKLFSEGRSFHWGSYRFRVGTTPVEALERLLDGRVEMISVTVVEGSDVATLAEQMTAAGIGTEDEWLAMAARTEWITDLMPAATSLEGFFFPDTYRFAEAVDVATAARHMVDRFRAVWTEERSGKSQLWGDDLDLVILASLVEAETGVAGERRRVAGVYVNRLRRGMLLQCDPTVVFSLKRRGEWDGRLLRIHWGVDDPYNTYRYPGLPPGPINSPGRAALAASLDPEDHRYLYFVAAPGGGHTFSRTLAEHNRAVTIWQRSRR